MLIKRKIKYLVGYYCHETLFITIYSNFYAKNSALI